MKRSPRSRTGAGFGCGAALFAVDFFGAGFLPPARLAGVAFACLAFFAAGVLRAAYLLRAAESFSRSRTATLAGRALSRARARLSAWRAAVQFFLSMARLASLMACCRALILAGCRWGTGASAPLLRFCPAARVPQSVPEVRTTTERGLLLWLRRTTCVVPWLSGGACPGVATRRGHPRGRSVVARTLTGRRGEGGAVGTRLAFGERVLQGQTGGGHAVVLGEDQVLGAVLAVLLLVLALDDRERAENV